MRLSPRRALVGLTLPFLVVGIVGPSLADVITTNDGSQITVIVGGRQEPAATFTLKSWAQGSHCSSPSSSVRTTIRWYLRKVERERVFIEKIYVRITPSRGGYWDNMQLLKPNDALVKRKVAIGHFKRDVSVSTTMTVNEWVAIHKEDGRPIVLQNTVDLNNRGEELFTCHGLGTSYNHLFRK